MTAIGERSNILGMIGVLPNLSTLRQEINARQTADRVMAVIREYEFSDEIMRAMYLALTGEERSIVLALDDEDEY